MMRSPSHHLCLLLLSLACCLAAQEVNGGEEEAPCFCKDAAFCQPIRSNDPHPEVYGFKGGIQAQKWQQYDWSQVTTVAWADNQNLTCYAHSKGARVILQAPDPIPLSGDDGEIQTWIDKAIKVIKQKHMDGVVFDFENPLESGDSKAENYVKLINATTQAFHKAIPGSQISVCLAWSPNGIDGRWYDNLGLIEAADLAYIMVYDTRSQIFDQCVASANAAYPLTLLGLQQYLALGADPQKLILGVPWYGYSYPCLEPMGEKDVTCNIPQVPFRGVNCSDAAGKQVAYEFIMALLADGNTTTERQWDDYLKSPWFNYREIDGSIHQMWYDDAESLRLKYRLAKDLGLRGETDGSIHQMWYDDAESLSLKYRLAKDLGLRGVGPFTYDYLDPQADDTRSIRAEREAEEMWEALKAFTAP